jgi:hypothetical protein
MSLRNYIDQIGRQQPLHLKDVTAYKNGMMELCYEIKKGAENEPTD